MWEGEVGASSSLIYVTALINKHILFFAWVSAGLRFYQGLEKTVLKLEEKLKDVTGKRKKELDRIDEKEREKKAKGVV